jgi:hypothetical protein
LAQGDRQVIVLPEVALKQLMTQIVGATHGLVDTSGAQCTLGTIPEAQMRMAALIAVQIVAGQTVWPGDRPIKITRPKQRVGVFDFEEE